MDSPPIWITISDTEANVYDAAAIDFDDDFIYKELEKPMSKRSVPFIPLLRDEAIVSFRNWAEKPDKTEY